MLNSNCEIEKLWKKLAKIGHFNNDKSFSRLSNEIDVNVKEELRWRLKIILTNNIVPNIREIKKKKGKNDVCRMTLNDSDAEKKTKNWRKQGSRKIFKCVWEGAEYDHMWS